MKKILSMIVVVTLLLGLTACGSANTEDSSNSVTESGSQTETSTEQTSELTETEAETSNTTETSQKESAQESEASAEASAETSETAQESAAPQKEVLVVFFSATGTTKDVAEKIAKLMDADLYEIKAAVEYTEEDLDWHNSSSRTSLEQNDPTVRPEIGSETISLEGYKTIFIGYPIWWGEEPRILDTFVESYDFTGITLIPFCTSSSSGVGRSDQNLAENAGSGEWLDGKRFGAGPSEETVLEWLHEVT